MASRIQINGVYYDGGTIEVDVEGVGKLSNIESINYGASKETTKVKGAGRKYKGRTPGIISADDGSMEIHLAEFNNWMATAGSNDDFFDSKFDVTVNYRLSETDPLVSVKLKDCTPLNYSSAHSLAGADALVVSVSFSVLDLEF